MQIRNFCVSHCPPCTSLSQHNDKTYRVRTPERDWFHFLYVAFFELLKRFPAVLLFWLEKWQVHLGFGRTSGSSWAYHGPRGLWHPICWADFAMGLHWLKYLHQQRLSPRYRGPLVLRCTVKLLRSFIKRLLSAVPEFSKSTHHNPGISAPLNPTRVLYSLAKLSFFLNILIQVRWHPSTS